MIVTESAEDRWQCTFSNGTVDVLADTTSDHGGSDTGIRPHELLEAAFGTCLNMTVRMRAAERDVGPVSVETTVDLDRSGEPPTFNYAIDVTGVDEQTAAELRAAATACPVQETLSGDIAFERTPDLLE